MIIWSCAHKGECHQLCEKWPSDIFWWCVAIPMLIWENPHVSLSQLAGLPIWEMTILFFFGFHRMAPAVHDAFIFLVYGVASSFLQRAGLIDGSESQALQILELQTSWLLRLDPACSVLNVHGDSKGSIATSALGSWILWEINMRGCPSRLKMTLCRVLLDMFGEEMPILVQQYGSRVCQNPTIEAYIGCFCWGLNYWWIGNLLPWFQSQSYSSWIF